MKADKEVNVRNIKASFKEECVWHHTGTFLSICMQKDGKGLLWVAMVAPQPMSDMCGLSAASHDVTPFRLSHAQT